MTRARRPPRPLDEAALEALATRYVARFATSRAKLDDYLRRKIRERGWTDGTPPPIERIVGKLCELGYVDDAQFALAKARSLAARGYGERRLRVSLRQAGIGETDSAEAGEFAHSNEIRSAIRFAQRRRIGPFADGTAERAQREKWVGAMVRAGHGVDLARRIASLEPGSPIDEDELGA